MNWRRVGAVGGGIFLLIVSLGAVFGLPTYLLFTPTETGAAAGLAAEDVDSEVIAENLDVPWAIAVLSDDRFLVSERTGDLLLIENGDQYVIEQFDELKQPVLGEGGLLGIAVHPDFKDNRYLYVYQTVDREAVENTVRRFELDLEARELRNETVIVDGIPSGRFHNGGRIAFGPDGRLYLTTGDGTEPALAQNRSSLAGKILRLNPDGSIPDDNPFDNAVYSYGHRNPQGLAWDEAGRLWSTEHGPDGRDELNRIEAGANYGWPTISGSETASDLRSPVFHSGEHATWAPAGVAATDGRVFFAGLRGERLYEASVDDGEVISFVGHFAGDFGRLRAVTLGPDGERLYLSTSNTDGRGREQTGDDKLIRVPVETIQ